MVDGRESKTGWNRPNDVPPRRALTRLLCSCPDCQAGSSSTAAVRVFAHNPERGGGLRLMAAVLALTQLR